MNPVAQARVTIGLPVYNGGDTLRSVLESIVAQTFPDFKVVISDNASSDATETICREYQKKDGRMVYVRQPQNIGAEANFDFVLAAADTKYFMWAAADDVRSSDFLEKNMEYLEGNPAFVASTCPVRFEGSDFDPVQMGDQTIDHDDPFERILKSFEGWHANGRMYSLFKTEALRNAKLIQCRYLGGDWTLMINLLFNGKFKRLDSGFVERGKKGVSNSLNIFSIYRNGMICWVIPFFDMSLDVLKLFRKAKSRQKMRLLWLLLQLNGNAFREQIKYELQKGYLKFRRTQAATEP